MYNLSGGNMLDNFHKIINEICAKNNIETKLVSKDWVTILKKDNKVRFITGCKFPLNNHATSEIVDDKYALYDVLRYLDIPVCEHHILYNSNNKNKYALDANDRSFLRSKLCCDMANRMGVPSIQAIYARLYMNNEYWGLYFPYKTPSSKT